MKLSKASLYTLLCTSLISMLGCAIIWLMQRHVETDIAYVGTRIYEIKSPVNGVISHSSLTDFARVPSRAILLQLRPDEQFDLNIQQYALETQKIDFAISKLQAEREMTQIQIKKFEGQLVAAKGDAETAASELSRQSSLYHRGLIEIASLEKTAQSVRQAGSVLNTIQTEIMAAKKQLDILQDSIASVETDRKITDRKQEAEQRKAALADVFAPTELTVAKVFHGTGEWVEQGQLIAHAYNPQDLWVDAYFDESDLAKLHLGQQVYITFDSLEKNFSGTIGSISSVGGAILSPLSPNYSSGHVIRITQRYIARIPLSSIRTTDPSATPELSLQDFIRPGMSARVDVTPP